MSFQSIGKKKRSSIKRELLTGRLVGFKEGKGGVEKGPSKEDGPRYRIRPGRYPILGDELQRRRVKTAPNAALKNENRENEKKRGEECQITGRGMPGGLPQKRRVSGVLG